jgi:hypothetical protein
VGSNPYPRNKKSPTTDVVGDFLAVLNLIYIFRYAESQKALSRNGFFSSYRSACV